MGCSFSSRSPRVSGARVVNKQQKGRTDIPSARSEGPKKLLGGFFSVDIRDSFQFMKKSVRKIKCPGGKVPILCLNDDSFPVVLISLYFGDDKMIKIRLPIVAASVHALGRLICFSHIELLFNEYFYEENTRHFLNNCFSWLTANTSVMIPVLLLGISRIYRDDILRSLKALDLMIEYSDTSKNLEKYKFIIITSDINITQDMYEDLINYSANGGGIAVFYVPSENFESPNGHQINKFLFQYGLSYAFGILSNHNRRPQNIIVSQSFDTVKYYSLNPLIDKFVDMLKLPNINIQALDSVVTMLRCYIMVLPDSELEVIMELHDAIWNFLRNTNYRVEGKICPDAMHVIVLVLLQDLTWRIPPDRLPIYPDIDIFPGESGNLELEDYVVDLKIKDEALYSTGLWLPPGVIGTITVDGEYPKDSVIIQIGSHSQSILMESGPWARWPFVVYSYPLDDLEIRVITNLGGIVYLAVSRLKEPVHIRLKFHKFCCYPRYISHKPDVWEKTKNLDVPWGEIQSKMIIFTLPKNKLDEIQDLNAALGRIDFIIKKISKLLSYEVVRPYRVVFDVQKLSSIPTPENIIMMHVDDIPGILIHSDQPNGSLFSLIRVLIKVSIKEGFFDDITEVAFSALEATIIFKEIFPKFDLLSADFFEAPPLYNELSTIHFKINDKIIPTVLKNSLTYQPKENEFPDDRWVSFIESICKIGKINFTKLFENTIPIPLNISSYIEKYPPVEL
ncbi:hypothetical protein TRFO_39432 [Tritrichomonas foetus]|uniref:Peptidase M60 domain-containing protein n=1 Tax=Tritrichomonas foetus TaxID=1144522 RepID=A0A1J4J4Z4_9EUKA|nr:hypothetical protein TRFO_39432 [Tritrichomonas foetus]|eukprot:OHS94386.1 hypothetical protein TRFO_39432 [Tritrichomonas foetus]